MPSSDPTATNALDPKAVSQLPDPTATTPESEPAGCKSPTVKTESPVGVPTTECGEATGSDAISRESPTTNAESDPIASTSTTSPSPKGSDNQSAEGDSDLDVALRRRAKTTGDTHKSPPEPNPRRAARTARRLLRRKESPAPAPPTATEETPTAAAVPETPGKTEDAAATSAPDAPRRRSSRIAGIPDFAWVEGPKLKFPPSPALLKAAAARAVRKSALDDIKEKRDAKAVAKGKAKVKAKKTEARKSLSPRGGRTTAKPIAGPRVVEPEKAVKSGRVEKAKGTTSCKK